MKSNRVILPSCVAAICLAALPGAGRADTVIYDNGAPDQFGTYNADANNLFTLDGSTFVLNPGSSTITGATWWGGCADEGRCPAGDFTIAPHSVSIWQYQVNATAPEAGSIGPHTGQPGMQVTMAGDGFGTLQGSVLFGSIPAPIVSWSNAMVTFTVPAVSNGGYDVQLKSGGGASANTIPFTVLAAKLIPVTFTVHNAAQTNPGDYIFVTGNTVELGNWGTTFQTAVGPMLAPNYPDWFLNVSLPAGQTVEFKFIVIHSDGSVQWEGGANHSFKVPTSGTSALDVTWQQ